MPCVACCVLLFVERWLLCVGCSCLLCVVCLLLSAVRLCDVCRLLCVVCCALFDDRCVLFVAGLFRLLFIVV